MDVVGFVPSKLNSQRLPRKNIRPLGGRPLVNYALQTLNEARVTNTVIFSSDDEVTHHIEHNLSYTYVQRDSSLDADSASVQDFVQAFLSAVPCDVVVLLHITSPFITPQTISDCVDAVVSGRHQSAFAALEMKRFTWFRGSPLNYDLTRPTPRTQDLEPVVVEQSGLYVFTRELFERNGRRIAENPYVHIVNSIEGHDIDTPEEFEFAELIVRSRAHE